MTKFTIALREIGTYREVLRSQVEHMLNDRLHQFVAGDLQDVKVGRRGAGVGTYNQYIRQGLQSLQLFCRRMLGDGISRLEFF